MGDKRSEKQHDARRSKREETTAAKTGLSQAERERLEKKARAAAEQGAKHGGDRTEDDLVDEASRDSFPASDPPSFR